MSIRLTLALLVAAALVTGCGRGDPAKFIASAEGYIAKHKYSAAVIELKNALAAQPDNAKARFLLGESLLEGGDAEGAALELRKALALRYPADEVYPLLARSWAMQGAAKAGMQEFIDAPVQGAHAKAQLATTLALVDLQNRQVAQARERVEQALALEPKNISARLAKARMLMADDDTKGALKLADAVVAEAPDNLDALMAKSQYEIALGMRDEARSTLERIVATRGDAFHARYLLTSSYMQAREVDKAAAQVEILKKQMPKDARTWHAIAMVAYARGDNEVALEAVQKSLQVAPDFMPARYLSGLVDMRRGAYGSAEQSLRSVLTLVPSDAGARIALSQTMLARGQVVKAQETLQPLLASQPNDVGALRLGAEIELALKHPERAMALVERANTLDDANVGGRVRLAQMRMATGNTAQGISDLQQMAAAEGSKAEPDLVLIQTYIQTRAYDKALAAADALIKKDPRNAAAYNAKGTVYGVQGDMKNARQAYEKALEINPDYAAALFNLASIDAIERKFDDATKRYQKVLVKDPKSEKALIGIAQVQMASGAKREDVIASLQRVVSANPASPTARQALIAYLSMQRDFKAAISAGQAAVAVMPEVPGILEALGAAQVAGNEKNQAIDTYTRLAKLQPDNPVPWMRVGAIHASLKNYDGSIAALKNAIAIAPTNTTIWIALAAVYKEANKFDAGLTEARRLQKDLSTRIAGYGLEAELFAAQKKMAEALAAYGNAFQRDPLPAVVVRMAMFQNALGKPDEAAALTKKWIDEHPKDVIVRTYLGQQSLSKGDFKAAVAYFTKASEVDPENLTLLNDLAWALAEAKDPKGAEYAQRAYRLAPNNPAITNTYGWALFQRGDTVQGLQLLRRAVDLDPTDANRRLYLAKALIQSGDKPAARKELEIVANAESPRARDEAKQLLERL